MDREAISCNISFPWSLSPCLGQDIESGSLVVLEVLLQMENFPVITGLKIPLVQCDPLRHHWAQGEDTHGDGMGISECRNSS